MKTTEIYRKTAKAVSSFVAIVALAGAMMVPQLHAAPPTDADLAALNATLVANNSGNPFLTNGKALNVFSASTSQLKEAVLDLYTATPTLSNATDLIEAIAGARGNAAAAVLDDLLEAVVGAFPGGVDTLVNAAAVAAPLYSANLAKEGLDQAEISTLPAEATGIMTLLAASVPSQAGNVAKKFLQTVDTGANLNPAVTAANAMTALFSDANITIDVAAAVAKKAGQGTASFNPTALAAIVDAAADAAPAGIKLGVILSFADGAWDATSALAEQTQIKTVVATPAFNDAIDLFYTNRAAGTSLTTDLGALSAAVSGNPSDVVNLTLAAIYADSGAGAGSIVQQSSVGISKANALAIASGATIGRPKSAENIARGVARGYAVAGDVDEIASAVAAASPFYAGKVIKKLNTDSTLGLLAGQKDDVVVAVYTAVPEQAGKIGYWGIGKTFAGSAANDAAVIAQFGVVDAISSTTAETASLAAGIIAARKTLQTGTGVSSLAAAASDTAAATRGAQVAMDLSLDKKVDSKPGLKLIESITNTDSASDKFDKAMAALTTLEGISTSDFLSVLSAGVVSVGGGVSGEALYDYMASLLAVKNFATNPNAKQKQLDAAYDSATEVLGLGIAPDGTVYTAVLNRARTFGNKSLTAAIVTGATYAKWERASEISKGAAKGQPTQAGKAAAAAIRAANLAYQNSEGNFAWGDHAYYHGVSGAEVQSTANGFDIDTDQAVAAAAIIASAVDGVTEGIAYDLAHASQEYTAESNAIKAVIKDGTKEALNEHKSVKLASGGNDAGDERQQVRGVVAGGFIGLDTANVTGAFIDLLELIVTEATKAAKMYALDIAYTAAEVLAARGHATPAHKTAIVAAILAAGPNPTRTGQNLSDAYDNGLTGGAADAGTFGTLAYLAANKNPSNLPVTDISGNSGL